MLLPLAAIPFGLPSGIFWLIGVVAALVSFCHIVYKIGQKWWARISSRHYVFDGKTLIRPFLTIAVMVMAFTSYKVSENAARTYALKVAEQVQSICIKYGECPNEMPGWTRHDSEYVSTAGAIMRFTIRYRAIEDGKAFALAVRWNIDSRFVVMGGVNSILKSEEIRS